MFNKRRDISLDGACVTSMRMMPRVATTGVFSRNPSLVVVFQPRLARQNKWPGGPADPMRTFGGSGGFCCRTLRFRRAARRNKRSSPRRERRKRQPIVHRPSRPMLTIDDRAKQTIADGVNAVASSATREASSRPAGIPVVGIRGARRIKPKWNRWNLSLMLHFTVHGCGIKRPIKRALTIGGDLRQD